MNSAVFSVVYAENIVKNNILPDDGLLQQSRIYCCKNNNKLSRIRNILQ